MKRSMLRTLVCPDTHTPFDVDVTVSSGDEVLEGKLSSPAGGVAASNPQRGAFPIHAGIPEFVSREVLETQTVKSFAQKWSKHDYYRRETSRFYTEWYLERYRFGDEAGLRSFLSSKKLVLDAGTGTGRDAANFARLSQAEVLAVDTSIDALRTARKDVGHPRVCFLHADINRLPVPDESFDFINCDQVIHHTPDPRGTFDNLRRKLKTGGHICCYVYRKKAPVREFTDDFVRERIRGLSPVDAMRFCEGITHLGQSLAEMKATVEVKEDIPALGIKKGSHDLQRFFHWNIMKCFWNESFDFYTNNIINFDWFHPELCFRYEPGEFRGWFADGWEIEAWDEQEAGLSCRARKV